MAQTVALTLNLYDGSGTPVTKGRAVLTPQVQLQDQADGMEIIQAPIPVPLAGGLPVVDLIPTDAPGPAPAGWAWGIAFQDVPGNPLPFNFIVPAGPLAFTATQGDPGTVTVTPANQFTAVPVGAGIQFTGTAPGGTETGITYYVVSSDGVNLEVADTPSGDAIAFTSAGSGTVTVVSYLLSSVTQVTSLNVMGTYMPAPSGQAASGTVPIGQGDGQASTWGRLSVSQVTGAAPLASPAFSGTPTATTPASNDNSTKLATTAFVQSEADPAGAAAAVAAASLQKSASLSDVASPSAARTALGLGTAAVQPASAFTQAANGGQETVSTITGATGNVTLNLSAGNVFNVTMANSTAVTLAFSGATAGVSCSFTLYLLQGTTGNATVTWPTSVVWLSGSAPVISSAGNSVTVLVFETTSNGVTWYGSVVSGAPSLAQLDARYAALANANTFTGNQTAPALVASGLTGATAASRYVGATVSGPPTSGTFALGDFIIDQSGSIWICTTAGVIGSGGLFTEVSGSSGGGGGSDTNAWAPEDNGFITSSAIPPHLVLNGTSGTGTPGAATMYFFRMPIRANATISNLIIGAGPTAPQAATGVVSTGTFGAFFSPSGTRLAVSAEAGAIFGTAPVNGVWTIPMIGSFTATPPWIYGVLLTNLSGSTTLPLLATTSNGNQAKISANTGLAPGTLLFAGITSAGTSIPTSITLTNAVAANAQPFFLAAS